MNPALTRLLACPSCQGDLELEATSSRPVELGDLKSRADMDGAPWTKNTTDIGILARVPSSPSLVASR